MGRAPCCEKLGLNKGKWTQEEDEILLNYIKVHGEGSWRSLPKKAGLLRCGKSCRLRWINYLRTGIKRGNFSREEDELIIRLHAILGTRWSKIACQLHGRTDNEIKNYWNSHLSRRIHSYYHQVNMDTNTQLESMTPSKSSHKICDKHSEEISQTPTNKVDNTLNPHHSTSLKCCDQEVGTSKSEFSDRSDVLCTRKDDGFNRPFSPRTLETIKATSEYSTITDEPSTSKDDSEIGPCFSPDLSSIFRDIENLLDNNNKDTEMEHGNNSNKLGDVNDGLLLEKGLGMEKEGQFGDLGWLDFLWDLDLWSSMRFCGG